MPRPYKGKPRKPEAQPEPAAAGGDAAAEPSVVSMLANATVVRSSPAQQPPAGPPPQYPTVAMAAAANLQVLQANSPATGTAQPPPPTGHRCTGCNGTYGSVDELASHMEAANHGTWYDCKTPRCGWSFATQQSLQEHVAQYHPQQQRQAAQQAQPQLHQPQQHQQQQQQAAYAAAQLQQQQVYQQQMQNYAAQQAYQYQQQQHQYQQRSGVPAPRSGNEPQGRGRGGAGAGGGASFAQMAAAAAHNPQPMTRQLGAGTLAKTQLEEGASLTGDSRKTYDAIVKAFIEDDARGELQFPPTLTAQERHHVHKLCMHYSLDHQSSGQGPTRQLKIWKPNWVPPGDEGGGDGDEAYGGAPSVGSTFDGFIGCQPLNDEYLEDHVDEIERLAAGPAEEMNSRMLSTLAHAAVVEEKRRQRREERIKRGNCAWFGGNTPTTDPKTREKGESLQTFRHRLPAYKMKDDIVNAVQSNKVVILSGDTGCGKTTQLPQMLYDAGIGRDMPGRGMILCTQPRRVSAISVAQRVAEERGEKCGNTVGYSIRFENVASSATRICYLTTGILLRRLHSDPDLSGVAAVIVDEVHERDVDTDFALLLLRDLVRSRKCNIRLVVMSATIQIDKLVKYFTPPERRAPPLISIPGALFDVKEYWLDEALQWLGADPKSVPSMAAAIEAAKKAAAPDPAAAGDGQSDAYGDMKAAALARMDKKATETTVPIEVIVGIIELYHRQNPTSSAVLVFLPGWAAIDKTMNMLRQKTNISRELSILPLHSSLTTSEQQRVFFPAPRNMRKIVLATNIAETSITIDDIVLVIDSCLHKGTSYDSVGNTSSLTSQLIAKANGKQRRGRAGRVKAGVCVHLLPRASYDALPDFLAPEMQRTALEEICLQVKAIVDNAPCVDVLSKALDAPSNTSIRHAVQHLYAIGALDSKERLTALGNVLATMPLHPSLGKMLLLGASLGVFEPLATLAASLSGKSPFVRPLPHQMIEARAAMQQFDKGKYSDHFTVLELYAQWSKSPRRSDFAYSHWADHMALNNMERMRGQLRRLLMQSGFLKKASPGWESRYATNESLIKFALAHSLAPRLGVFERDLRDRNNNLFCWDNKPSTVHPSSLLAKVKLKQVRGAEFMVYFDRMRVESQLCIFDATMLPRTTALLAAKTLDVIDTDLIDEETRIDDRKFRAWDSPERDAAKAQSTLVMDGGKKRFMAAQRTAAVLMAVHDVVNFNFAVAMQRMDVRAVTDDVVNLLAFALGDPAKAIDPATVADTAAASGSADVRLGPSASAMAPNVLDAASSSEDDVDEAVPEVVNSSDDDDVGDDGAEVTDKGGAAAKGSKLTEHEADVLVRAFGDLSWISRRTVGATTTGDAPEREVRPAAAAAALDAEEVKADSGAAAAAAAGAAAAPSAVERRDVFVDPAIVASGEGGDAAVAAVDEDDDEDDDDDDGDEVVAAPDGFDF